MEDWLSNGPKSMICRKWYEQDIYWYPDVSFATNPLAVHLDDFDVQSICREDDFQH